MNESFAKLPCTNVIRACRAGKKWIEFDRKIHEDESFIYSGRGEPLKFLGFTLRKAIKREDYKIGNLEIVHQKMYEAIDALEKLAIAKSKFDGDVINVSAKDFSWIESFYEE